MIPGFDANHEPGDRNRVPERGPAHGDPELQAALDMADQHEAIRSQMVAARESHARQRRELGMER